MGMTANPCKALTFRVYDILRGGAGSKALEWKGVWPHTFSQLKWVSSADTNYRRDPQDLTRDPTVWTGWDPAESCYWYNY